MELLNQQAPLGQPPVELALCELFPRIGFPTGGQSTEIGVDVDHWEAAVKAVIGAIRARSVAFPGIVSVRFVRGSPQLLAQARFPVTCTIELPIGATNATLPLFRSVWKALDTAGVPFTLHWGQTSELTPADVVAKWGQPELDRWKTARFKLLGAVGSRTFRNVLSDTSGLT